MEKQKEGWGWPPLSKKAHYFDGGRSLCGKWLFLGVVEQGGDESPDNCQQCRRELEKGRDKA